MENKFLSALFICKKSYNKEETIMSRFKTVREATEAWVHEMNAIPQGMISRLFQDHPEDWTEVTKPSKYDRVYVYENGDYGEITEIEDDIYTIELDNGEVIECETSDFEINRDDYLPMWGTMWSFGDSCDDWWLEEDDGIKKMSECGFRIYESEEFGYFFGIDGAGYDFYSEHWIPLYKARGLEWHDVEKED